MKSINTNFEFVPKNTVLRNFGVNHRPGEFRNIDYLTFDIKEATFVMLGISEWVGPFANYGRPGADRAFAAFLSYFLPQPNSKKSFDLLGNIEFTGVFPETIEQAGCMVEELDALVERVLTEMIKPNQIPIVIGGGHNNALPLIRWAHAQRSVVHCLNFDAHFDCRKPGLRHSGNAFSTAILEGILQKYSVLGVDTYAMNDYIRTFVNEYHVSFVPHTEYLQGRGLLEDVAKVISQDPPIGLDIDVDCIENMPSSAQSPSGFTLNQLRQVVLALKKSPIAYMHLCEGAPTNPAEERTLGKALSFLVLDFLTAME